MLLPGPRGHVRGWGLGPQQEEGSVPASGSLRRERTQEGQRQCRPGVRAGHPVPDRSAAGPAETISHRHAGPQHRPPSASRNRGPILLPQRSELNAPSPGHPRGGGRGRGREHLRSSSRLRTKDHGTATKPGKPQILRPGARLTPKVLPTSSQHRQPGDHAAMCPQRGRKVCVLAPAAPGRESLRELSGTFQALMVA